MKKVVYILGAGNSGSTLLSMVLGAHNDIFSVGELSKIYKFARENLLCTCGESFSSCEFWNEVVSSIDLESLDIRPRSRLKEIILAEYLRTINCHESPHFFSRNITLYEKVFSVVKAPVLVDSSKDLSRFFYLFDNPYFHIVPLYVVRDGRAYIDSYLRRGGTSPLKATLKWIRMNLLTEAILKRLKIDYKQFRIEYESFTKNPALILNRICQLIGVDYEEEMCAYYNHVFHNIAGFRGRFDLRPIKTKNKWRDRISVSSKITFFLLGGHYFNSRFGIR